MGPSSDQCLCTCVLQVKQLVDEELFARYDRLLLQTTLDLMADVVYCPRKSCGTAVMVEPDRTMGICSACQYAFCTLCKLGYHGLSKCKLRAGNVCISSRFLSLLFFFLILLPPVWSKPYFLVLQMNFVASKTSTCRPPRRERNSWSNALGRR